jgi:hypothetical protein
MMEFINPAFWNEMNDMFDLIYGITAALVGATSNSSGGGGVGLRGKRREGFLEFFRICFLSLFQKN